MLSSRGAALTSLPLPPALLGPEVVGTTSWHAALVFDPVAFLATFATSAGR